MSGIPLLGTWATLAVYPSGAFSGQATKTVPATPYFIPGTGGAAPEVNYEFNALFAQDQQEQNAGIAHALNQWSVITTATTLQSGSSFVAGGWDQQNGRWLTLLIESTNTFFLYESLDTGRDWTLCNSAVPGSLATGMAVALGSVLIAIPSASAGGSIQGWYLDSAGTAHGSYVIASGNNTYAAAGYVGTIGWWNIYAVNQSGGTFTANFYLTGASPTSAGVWASETSSLPASWQSGTNHVGHVLFATNNSTIGLWGMGGVTAGTDTARLMTQTSGPTFTDVTPSVLSGKIITGLTYGANDNLWGMLAYDGTNTTFYVSSNPSNTSSWAAVDTFIGVKCQGVAAVGSVWAVGVPYVLGPDSGSRIMLENGVATAYASATTATRSWTQCSILDAVPLAQAFCSSSNGLFAASAVAIECSQQYGLL